MPTKSTLPPGVRAVRHRLASGEVALYLYHRATGARLPALDDPGFPAALEAANRSIGAGRVLPGSIAEIIREYRRSPAYVDLRPKSRSITDYALGMLADIDHLSAAALRRGHVLRLRDAIATSRGPAAANHFTGRVSALYGWALDRELVEVNPCARIKRLAIGEIEPWTDAEVAEAARRLPEPLRRVLVLACYTAQRRSDLHVLRWSDRRDGALHFVQRKTGEPMTIAEGETLAAELDSWRAGASSICILTDARGVPWRYSQMGKAMRLALESLGLRTADRPLSLHGLRKWALTYLAEAGGSARMGAALGGHRTLAEVERYNRRADKRILTEAAARLLPADLSKIGKGRK